MSLQNVCICFYPWLARRQEWTNPARDDVWRLRKNPPFASVLIHIQPEDGNNNICLNVRETTILVAAHSRKQKLFSSEFF